jgi:hypothetical protein
MDSIYINLRLVLESDQNNDDWDYLNDNKSCSICKLSFCNNDNVNIYKQYTASVSEIKKKCKLCYLCYIIINFKKYHISNVVLDKSKLSQIDINKKTIEYFNEHNYIPLPTNIDKKVKLIKLQSYEFAHILENSNYDAIFDDYKIFFTNNVSKGIKIYKRPVKNLFTTKSESVDEIEDNLTTIDYFNIPVYKFTDEENHIILKLRKNINAINNKQSINIKKSLDNKNNITGMMLDHIHMLSIK